MNKGMFSRFDMKQRAVSLARNAVVIGLTVGTSVAMAADDAGIGTAITSLQTTILGYIGQAIAACVAIMLVALGGDVGISVAKKWLKKGAS